MGSDERASWPTVPGYEIHTVLGRGGFATVYRATQTSVGREVALKVLSGGAIDANAERRFRHEVAAVAALSDHDHVVSVYDVGTTPDDLPFIAMQLVTAGSLADRVRAEGPLPADEVARIGAEVADALEAAHEAGILHRDIKPDNVLVGRRGRSLLTDFGIATLTDATRTATGMITGTLPFTAPEIFRGQRPSPATDVYALGATLYVLAAGRMAFATADEHVAAVMYRITNEPHPPLPADVPLPLAEVVDGCLAKDPDERPTLAEVQTRLGPLAAAGATPTPPPTPIPPTPVPGPPPPRRPPTPPATPVAPAPDLDATVVEAQAPDPAAAATRVQRPEPDAATRVQQPEPEPDAATRIQQPDTAPGAPSAPAPPAPAPARSSGDGSSRRGLVLGGVGILVVLALGVGVVLALTSGGGDGDDGSGGGGAPSELAVGAGPVAVVADDTGVWVANRDDATVTHLDGDGEEIAVTDVGNGPIAIASGAGGVWVANRDDSTVTRIDPDSGEALAQPGVGDTPSELSANDELLYVWNSGDMDVNTVDPATDEYGTDTGLPAFGTSDLSATSDQVYVAQAGDDGTNVLAVFGADLSEITTIALPGAPTGVVATDDGVWVALGGDGIVARIDPETEEVTTIDVGGDLRAMRRDGDDVWVGDIEAEEVIRLDIDSDEVAERVDVGAAPDDFAVADGVVWVPVPDDGVVRRIPI